MDVDQRAFPAAPPSDLDDPQVIVENDWKAFAAIDRMTNHWSKPGWSGSHRSYYWMLTFSGTPSLLSHVRHCQSELAHLGMDAVPNDVLHVTMPRIGNINQVTAAQIDHLVTLAEHAPLERFHLFAHPLTGSRGAVRFTLSPWTPLVRLYAVLSDIGREAGVPGGKPTAAFRPHLGLQYNNRDRPAEPVIEAVAHLRSLPPVVVDIAAVDLVELRRTSGAQRAYRWSLRRTVHLGPWSTARR
ncbi:2'-5' RNA ligase family protein (plasmid) [Streptomyces sp. S1D4-20]|nr:2'-5' RNA ligase family protein [Streptomyces sp. S1D4-20]